MKITIISNSFSHINMIQNIGQNLCSFDSCEMKHNKYFGMKRVRSINDFEDVFVIHQLLIFNFNTFIQIHKCIFIKLASTLKKYFSTLGP